MSERDVKDHGTPRGGSSKGNNKSNNKGKRPADQARFILAGPAQWAVMLMQMLTLLPGKPGDRNGAWTVDDAIRAICTIHVFRMDVNLAIDVFRELKENKVQVQYIIIFYQKE